MASDVTRAASPDRRRRCTSRRGRGGAALACALAVLFMPAMPVPGNATPFVPGDDNTVLERLPFRANDAAGSELRGMRRALARDPGNLALAEKVAQRDIELARREADPRFLGYAEAALAPWWRLSQPPASVLVLRAILRQANHEFTAALLDLSTALAAEPRNAQALLTRASIQQAMGDYTAARKTCFTLAPLVSALTGYACLTSVMNVNGEAARSYALLQRVATPAASLDRSQTQWIEGLLAEMAARQGAMAAADQHYQNALAAGDADSYLLASYADFLLDAGRAKEVVHLLRERTRADPLLLRLTLAERALQLPALREHIAALQARFDASRLRGDVVHRREQARFELELLHNPGVAVQLARANWAVQREPADARVLLEAALAAGEPAAAAPVLHWLAQSRLQDAHITALVKKLQDAAS